MVKEGQFIGLLIAIFFGTGCVILVATLITNSPSLKISEKGFNIKSIFRSSFTKWNEVGQFKTGYIGKNKMVVYNYSQNYNKNVTSRTISREMTGVEVAIPDTYGKSPEELAKLLNEWRERYLNN